jgi:hypothetical protein
MIDYRFEYIRNQITDEILMEQQKSNNEKIQQTKEDIAVLQEKLKKLEELEIQKSKSPVEKAFKEVYGYYPEGCERSIWFAFQKGYEVAHKDTVENNKNFEPTPQTPEQVEQGLRDAMKKAKEDAVFDEPKTETLHDVIYKWKYDTSDSTCDVLVDMIEEWLPDKIEYEDDEEYEIGWNEAIQAIKGKLR